MSMHKGILGRYPTSDDNGPGSVGWSGRKEDHTLADYLNKKYKHEAFDNVAAVQVRMFDFWNSNKDVEELLILLRIATTGYPSSEACYGSIKEFIKTYKER